MVVTIEAGICWGPLENYAATLRNAHLPQVMSAELSVHSTSRHP
jgi:hypothetical protein